MQKQIIDVAIKGIAPLLMNKYVDDGDSKKTRKNYDDQKEAEKRLYLDENGNLAQPGEHIEGAMIAAGVNFKYAGRKTFKDYLKAGLFVSESLITHKIQKWEIDKRPVVVQKSRIPRCRPMLNEWELDFQFEIWDSNIDPGDVNEILVHAGRFVGIGDYRPKFGRFIVTKFEYKK